MYLLYCLYTAYIRRLYPLIDTWLHDLSTSLSSSLVLIIFLFYFIPPEFLAENDMFIYFELNFLIHFLRKLLQWRKEIRIVCPKVGTLILTAPSEIFSNATKTLIFWIPNPKIHCCVSNLGRWHSCGYFFGECVQNLDLSSNKLFRNLRKLIIRPIDIAQA